VFLEKAESSLMIVVRGKKGYTTRMSAFDILLRRFRKTDSARALQARFADLVLGLRVEVRAGERITVGRGCFFDTGVYLNAGSLRNHTGFIQFGDNCEIAPYTVLYGHGGLRIGNNVHIGPHVTITAHESRQIAPQVAGAFEPLDFRFGTIVIEDHVIICAGAVIAPGVRIGHHAMIAGGSLVSRDVPPYAFVRGIPASVVRYSTDSSVQAGQGELV
jgi:acetyltransferase-like isoleucine patch superfamily enzyme